MTDDQTHISELTKIRSRLGWNRENMVTIAARLKLLRVDGSVAISPTIISRAEKGVILSEPGAVHIAAILNHGYESRGYSERFTPEKIMSLFLEEQRWRESQRTQTDAPLEQKNAG